MKKLFIALFISIMLGGCANMFIKAFEKRILAGEWKKSGSTEEEFYNDSWECQKQTSYITPEGVMYDLKLFSACMYARGWRLVADGGQTDSPIMEIDSKE